jgi:thiol-disulfide isomerase/thioredoxin
VTEKEAMMEKENGEEMMLEDKMMEADQKTEDEMMEKEEDSMMKAGSYENYSSEKLAKAEEGGVVLFFRASWCPTCRALDSNIRSNLGNIPNNVTILDVDYDSSTTLKQKYGVTYQHTLVQVDAEGNIIKKWSGSPTLTALIAQIQ